MGASFVQSTHNFLQDGLRFLKHLVIPEPQDPKPPSYNLSISIHVVLPPLNVLPTIHFDDHSCLQAGEIGDIDAKRHLPPESISGKLPAS